MEEVPATLLEPFGGFFSFSCSCNVNDYIISFKCYHELFLLVVGIPGISGFGENLAKYGVE